MPKNIVLCSDGTGNTAIKGRGTNVWKVFEAVDLKCSDPNQIVYYDDGVGTERAKLLKLLGGAFGYGLKRNIKQLYTSLCRTYEVGDQIYLFGFSRGAFTARSLAGLIGACGIIDTHPLANAGVQVTSLTDSELNKLVNKSYRAFRKLFRSWWSEKIRKVIPSKKGEKVTSAFRTRYAVKHPEHSPGGVAKIRFVGVWDTVDAIGLPVDEAVKVLNWIWPFRFPDHRLGDHVRKGCHALAIDDQRKTFHPTMWDEHQEQKDSNRIEQVWFAGVHSNVGGGYPKQGVSLIPLGWMLEKAQSEGLCFLESEIKGYKDHENINDKLYNSRSGLAVYYRYLPRNISKICSENGVVPKIHVSVLRRISLAVDGYAPGNLPASFTVVPSNPEGNAAGESPAALRELEKKISGASRSSNTLVYDQAKIPVRIRIMSHYTLLAVTVAAFILSGKVPPPAEEASWLLRLLHYVASQVPILNDRIYALLTSRYVWIILATLALLYLVGGRMRKWSARIYSDFWRNVLSRQW